MVSRWCWAFSIAHGAVAFRSMQNDETLEAGALGQNRTLDPNRILCPVLAALWTSGNLPTDEFGNAERDDIRHALEHGAGVSSDFGGLQSMGIANYHRSHMFDQLTRDRCMPGFTGSGTACYARWLAGSSSPEVKRYLNIFEMNGLETVEHAMSTGVRGGNCNAPPQNDPCNGQYPCEALFQRFYASSANSDGRIYEQQIKEIICKAQTEGDRGGEMSYTHDPSPIPGIGALPSHKWQMNAAMLGWLSGFGRPDENGDLYFTVADARAMVMEGRLPDGWVRRPWGCLFERNCPTMYDGQPDRTMPALAVLPLPCDMDEPWWSETGVTVATGAHCRTNSHCAPHALCLAQRCICAKGRNGVQMLYEDGDCVEQPSRMYMGETCRYIRADNPASPNVWEEENA